ncbi:unnamed protein product [Soboliphyme baturini]|uniref:Peptidyl-prolyl cis-trans isomerase n=1 Tax=Soboliphyme baturini TaxID=241478 RepID=A0A183IEP6_9BILA|nr:unnamed protein product [Soboliphyme baturini]
MYLRSTTSTKSYLVRLISSVLGYSSQVKCSHILVKHRNSRRPSSWRQDKITRSKEDALELIEAKFTELKTASFTYKFSEIASKYSDCSSAKNDGDLGYFSRGEMQKAFEECAFALKIGDVSNPVFTDSGVHLIYRTA